jgi:CHAT domain-containing protein
VFDSTSSLLKIVCTALLLGAFVVSTPTQAEESLTYLETAGRYADLQREAERRIFTGRDSRATPLAYLCIAYGKLKQYEKLLDCAAKLDERIQRGDTVMDLDQRVMFISSSDARPLPETLRARAYFELGDFPKAAASGAQVLEILSRTPETGGTSLYPTVRYRMLALEVLGLCAVRTGDVNLAKRYAKQLEDVSIPFIGGRMWGWIRNNAIAQLYMALGLYAEALSHIPDTSSGMQIVASFVNGLGPYAYRGDSTTTILDLPRRVMRGKALVETGETAEAKAIFDQILTSSRIEDVGDLYWLVLFERGRIAETEKQLERAMALYREAIDIVELQRSTINTEGSKIGFVGDKQAVYQRLISSLFAEGQHAAAFEYIERSKARALVDMLASKQDFAVHTANATQVRTLLARADSAESEARVQSETADTKGTRSLAVQTRQQLQQQAPELSSLVTVTPVTVQEIQGKLPADEVLVEYYAEGKELYAFVLSKARLQGIKLNGEGLTAEVQNFRQALQDTRSTYHRDLAGKLYNRLVRPLEGSLTQRNILVVAHGPLHYLPFNALHDGNGYLIERHSIRLLPSASVLKYLKGVRPQTAGTLLAFGNPDLGDPRLDLKHAQTEALSVSKVLPNSKALVRNEASESAFKRYGAGFRYLHIASHGTFYADSPLNSALLLAKDSANDGTLTVGELYSMRLNADLVTLSACETGLGKIANGDDVVGLTRGFLYAGSRSIVASLWKVDDEATAYLMTRFYSALKGTSKREALRLAQIETRKKYVHPYYWAAFQLTGEAS